MSASTFSMPSWRSVRMRQHFDLRDSSTPSRQKRTKVFSLPGRGSSTAITTTPAAVSANDSQRFCWAYSGLMLRSGSIGFDPPGPIRL